MSNFFEIDARVESGSTPTVEEARLIIRKVLAERFGLQFHRAARDIPAYALTVMKDAPKAAVCSNPDAPSTYVPGVIISCQPPLPMTRLVQFLSREMDWPVIDQTGLKDMTFELRWLPTSVEAQPDSPPILVTALQEQLGLKLEPTKAPVDYLVIDHVERPEPD